MKHIILILVLIFCINYTRGQARIGDTEWEIRDEFSEKTFKSGTDSDGDKWISMETSISTVRYYFNALHEWQCYLTMIIPDNQAALNYLVEKYNKEYVIISETSWKMYGNNGIMKINLIFAEEGGYYFL
ncbi:MAG: hypothetical protein K1X92_12705, partial [Bacteroidia bacterium]|nr:hypothetical protein [Bacteroidia bacterium]